ncbi:MAG: SO_0444 family Cu/Zn efflux transporter [Kiritimatiellae bacterium]|jgi:uncharacterized membrane protein YraQ (UPF0718 family)|nr:SO_0444 family Cu/Zn efflux transporter [Kiritimatiellia bacterium]
MNTALHIATEVWRVVLMMAPYLLLGFAVAGVLSVVLTPAWVARHLGGRGRGQVIKAALLGVPLPLCSCGVLPLAFSLRRDGASKGATVSFLASTPQTGVDSILLTWSLLGPIIAAARVIAAFASGVLAGLLTDRVGNGERASPAADAAPAGCGCKGAQGQADAKARATNIEPAWRRAVRHGGITLPRDMARPLLFGVLVSGLVSALVPEGFFSGQLPPGIASYALALVVGIPLYVCSASSVPIAATFIHMGVSPGAAMVFLIAGPATNAAAVSAMWREIGRAGTAVYLTAIAVVALVTGAALDLAAERVRAGVPVVQAACGHAHPEALSPWAVAAALVFLALLLPGLWRAKRA